jgi:hypothetical protein
MGCGIGTPVALHVLPAVWLACDGAWWVAPNNPRANAPVMTTVAIAATVRRVRDPRVFHVVPGETCVRSNM